MLSLLLMLALSSAALAQKEIPLQDVARHVGDSVTLTGKVYGGRFFPQGEGRPTLLNLGAPYPNQLLTVVIRGTARPQFSFVPEKDLLNKDVRVSGKVELYKGKPQVVIYSPEQLTPVEADKTEPHQ